MVSNINIKTFDDWALLDKDKVMEEGHKPSVNHMIDIIENLLNSSDMDIGDMNQDGVLNILDVILITNIILNENVYNELADLNQDGSINVLDVILLITIILER